MEEVYLARSFASTNGEQIIGLDRERYFYSLVTRFLLSVYVSPKLSVIYGGTFKAK